MKVIHTISFIARLALMAAMVLGLLFWIAQISLISMHLDSVVQISLRSIHLVLGLVGAFAFVVLGIVAVFTRGIRLLGAGGMIYALVMPAFGLTQSLILVGNLHWVIQAAHLLVGIGAMYLALGIERRYRRLRLEENSATLTRETTSQALQ